MDAGGVMQQDSHLAPKALVRRLDRCAGELNAFLMVLAVGLAILDGTCFTALRFGDALINLHNPIVEGAQETSMYDLAR
jgi:hypothetical protein